MREKGAMLPALNGCWKQLLATGDQELALFLRLSLGMGLFWCARVDDSEAFGNKSYKRRKRFNVLHAPQTAPHALQSLSDVVFEIFWRNSCVNNKERHRSFLFT
ncbi:hypothetical protein ALP29_201305 [Pseudomonas syringae pv. avii]|uniref:Uncharacterized protein n=1 Tax=Pseudomonas syringae pv. avii TaxID=663959 RepID=A0A3M5V8B1_PSESX|nr:hypothetical protein ALP29_201305 [Pseudomonas syringae pv. avii]